MMVPNWLKFN